MLKRASLLLIVAVFWVLSRAAPAWAEEPTRPDPSGSMKLAVIDQALQFHQRAEQTRAAGDLAQAEKLYKRALRSAGELREAHLGLVQIYEAQGRPGKAEQHRSRAKRLEGKPSLLEERARLAALYPEYVAQTVNFELEDRLERGARLLMRALAAVGIVLIVVGMAVWRRDCAIARDPSKANSIFLAPFPEDQERTPPLPAIVRLGSFMIPYGFLFEILSALDMGFTRERLVMTVVGSSLFALVCQILFFAGVDVAPLRRHRPRS